MRTVTSISIPRKFNRKISQLSRAKGLTRSEMIREAIRQYVVREEFDALRRKALLAAQRRGGPYTDEEIFKAVS